MTAEKSIKSEADAMQSILEWSKERPAWQRDALRRIVTQGELEEADINELAMLCKDTSKEGEPFADTHFNAQKSGAPVVSLQKIRNAENVNALAEGQSLNFLPKGVTIVYGDNGAGKSGYVRILKRACRARTVRGKDEDILTNIYNNSDEAQRAELHYQAGAQSQKSQWKNGEPSEPLLSEISVFDSRTASVHVDETNDLAYTPYPMKLLEALVSVSKSVKNVIDAEITALKIQTPLSISSPICSDDTKTGKLIKSLSGKTKPDELENLATLSDAETTRLTELASDFAQNPEVVVKRLFAQQSRLEKIQIKVSLLVDAVSTKSITELKQLIDTHQAASDAATLASQDLSKSEPLNGVGSETWRLLWNAAREYSTKEAYPLTDFPMVDEDAKCLLCQQHLEEEAAKRLQRFENFVQDTTQQKEIEAIQGLDNFRHALKSSTFGWDQILQEYRFLADELGHKELADAFRDLVIRAQWKVRTLLKQTDISTENFDLSFQTDLKVTIETLSKRINSIQADNTSDEAKAARSEYAELKDRDWLCGVKNDVLAEIGRRKKNVALENALKDTRPNAITNKNTALSGALITDRLRGRFATEIDHLNLAGLAIELKQAGSQHGISRFKVSLVQNTSLNAGEVLSEGEYRCVALAGFMAELVTNDNDSGIIFDDPVSSLDHMHREAIAKRLAQEGRSRQVIVFTHDLPFLFMLRNACTQVNDLPDKTEVALRQIQKRQNIPGHCKNEGQEKAKSASQRIASMKKHLENTKIQYENDPDGTDWLVTARGLVDSLRQTWEAAVEDAIGPVLRTFSSKVDTKGFIKLSAITEEDAKSMRERYGQCSVLLHKTSDSINPAAPTPDIIESELSKIEEWITAVSERQGQI